MSSNCPHYLIMKIVENVAQLPFHKRTLDIHFMTDIKRSAAS